jgi:hypothetical protein
MFIQEVKMKHVWWLALILGCGSQEEAISEMVKVHIQTPVAVVAEAETVPVLDYLIAPPFPEEGTWTARWEQCLFDKQDVRQFFPPRLAMVEISPDMIRISGHGVVPLVDYVSSSEHRRGQLLIPLLEAAEAMAEDAKKAGYSGGCWPAFRGKILIAHAPGVQFSILREVMYTLGQAQFSDFGFVVAVGDPEAAQSVKIAPVNVYSKVSIIESGLPSIGPPMMGPPGSFPPK